MNEFIKERPATAIFVGLSVLLFAIAIFMSRGGNEDGPVEANGDAVPPEQQDDGQENVDADEDDGGSDDQSGDDPEPPEPEEVEPTEDVELEGAEEPHLELEGEERERIRERWGSAAASGLWLPERPEGMTAEDWWSDTILMLWFEGDDSTYVPDQGDLIDAWSQPGQSDLDAFVATELAEEALAIAEAEFTVDYDAQRRWPTYFLDNTDTFREDPVWIGWGPISGAAAALGEGWAQVLVLWEAPVAPRTGERLSGIQSTMYLFKQGDGGGWAPKPCFEADHLPSPCRNVFQSR